MDKPFTISSVKGNGQDYDQDRDFVLCALSPASQQSKGILAVVSACFFLTPDTCYIIYHYITQLICIEIKKISNRADMICLLSHFYYAQH